MSDQVSQAMSYQAEQLRRAERGAVPDPESVADPDGWPYSDENGLYVDDPAEGPTQRHSADPLTLADLTVRPDEVVCSACFLVHRPGRCDR
ncbi:hypothetical protein I5G58_gp092 [Mycobacterium phage BirdsNest]|uniref:Uncharacterized protein n=1 Tax=Mycobacterium phage BirdsNest TaxID=2686231 RepID=A0A6B9LHT2_9CAUD|nr:hypothetical protein I5G58_gp092 [Mycobacterium phage BirdsNest]QHB37394.1 hypothetical protein PBI_BIRDSNEST_92 [Mycobacterium phage BirdsNest]